MHRPDMKVLYTVVKYILDSTSRMYDCQGLRVLLAIAAALRWFIWYIAGWIGRDVENAKRGRYVFFGGYRREFDNV